MRILGFLLPVCLFAASCATPAASAECKFSPNPYLKRSITDNILFDIKAARDDGKSAAMIFPLIRKKIPLLSRLAIKKNMFGQTIVELTLEQPWVVITCEGEPLRVLTRSGVVAYAQIIRDDILANLASIILDKKANTDEQIKMLAQWLSKQPCTFFGRFSIVWHDKNDIEIHDEYLPLTTIRATQKTLFNTKNMIFLDEMRTNKQQYTTIDLRFEDQQIVLVPKKSKGRSI